MHGRVEVDMWAESEKETTVVLKPHKQGVTGNLLRDPGVQGGWDSRAS